LIDLGTKWISGQIIDHAIFLHEAGIRSAAVAHRPSVVIGANCPDKLRMAGVNSETQKK